MENTGLFPVRLAELLNPRHGCSHTLGRSCPSSSRNSPSTQPNQRQALAQAFDRLYAHSETLGPVCQEARAARQALPRANQAEMTATNNGAPLPLGFPGDAQRLVRIMANDGRVQLAFIELGG